MTIREILSAIAGGSVKNGEPNPLEPAVAEIAQSHNADVYLYVGEISTGGYERLSTFCESSSRPNAVLILTTAGGNPDAGFRIARALQHHYATIKIFVPRYCKSAGTLICLGANELVMGDRSELGPLDIQLPKPDEIFDWGSGLDMVQAMNFMQSQAKEAFLESLMELKSAGLGTKMASDVAVRFATDLFAPVYGQIDPMRLGEMQRKVRIANDYGERLAEKANSLRPGALTKLVVGFCSHSFIIDRKEAKSLFNVVRAPEGAAEVALVDWARKLPSDLSVGAPKVLNLSKSSGGPTNDARASTQNTSGVIGGGGGAGPQVAGPGNQANPEPAQPAAAEAANATGAQG
ncbi:MAG: hypothetical protein IT424_09015, partial [Pirellulales bacterium]|nr:hypothetical protein [Pirellulales bacterium]